MLKKIFFSFLGVGWGGSGCTTRSPFGQPRFTLLTHNLVSRRSKGKLLQVYTLKTTTDKHQSLCCSTKLPNNRLLLNHRNFYSRKSSQGIQKTPLLNSLRGKYVYSSVGHTKRRSFSFSLLALKVTVDSLPLRPSRFESQSADRLFR
jgi:hypothetical protein